MEFEKELFNISFSNLVTPFAKLEWTEYVNYIHKLNRRIINLLTTTRMYLDHIGHDIKEISLNNQDIDVLIKKLRSDEYDSKLGFRVMEALRNYVQHRGLPIHMISHKQSNVGGVGIKHVIVPIIKISDLESDDNFKRSVLNELKEQGETVDIRRFVREYLQSFYKIQACIRGIFSAEIVKSDSIFYKYYNLFESKYGKAKSLTISELTLNGFRINPVHIMMDIIKRRKLLENKNNIDRDLTINYVSGEL